MINKTDLAYAAGYIDGDGCFYIGKENVKNRLSPKFVSSIVISSINIEVLEWFKQSFGGSIHKTNSINPKHQNAQYNFTLRKIRSIPFIENILPYLVEKTDEANVAILFSTSSDIKEKILLIDRMNIIKRNTNLVCKSQKIEFESQRNTIIPTQEDFAYLAGFIDAECCLGVYRYRSKNNPNFYYNMLLQCNNTKAPVFKWLLQRFGGRIHFIDRNAKDPNQRNQFSWRLKGSFLTSILDNIYPFLKHKKPVCTELMKFNESILKNGGARHTDEFRVAYSETLKEREIIFHTVHKLNLKGTKNI